MCVSCGQLELTGFSPVKHEILTVRDPHLSLTEILMLTQNAAVGVEFNLGL